MKTYVRMKQIKKDSDWAPVVSLQVVANCPNFPLACMHTLARLPNDMKPTMLNPIEGFSKTLEVSFQIS